MTKPEQELLAKYLLQQLISREEEEQSIADPIIARLSRGDDLVEQGSQTIATIVPAPPGIESTDNKSKDQCKLPLYMGRGWVTLATQFNWFQSGTIRQGRPLWYTIQWFRSRYNYSFSHPARTGLTLTRHILNMLDITTVGAQGYVWDHIWLFALIRNET